MCKKVISFCLYGQKRKYCHGMIEAVISANLVYLDWEVWIYYSSSGTEKVPESVLRILKNLNCRLVPYNPIHDQSTEGMFRRFEPILDKNVDYLISRDSDSRSTLDEKQMVEEWIESDKTVHSILDHECHHSVMGGLFGLNLKKFREKYPEIYEKCSLTSNFSGKQKKIYNDDQMWLRKFLEYIVTKKKDIYIHSIAGSKMYNEKLPGVYSDTTVIRTKKSKLFCGQAFDVNMPNRPVVIVKDIQIEGLI